jgi:fusion protein PurCD
LLTQVDTPQLKCLHRGKVRDSFRINDDTRLIVVTDRISAFDYKLTPSIPSKGEILNRISAHWFNQTKHILPNHVISVIDPQAMLVREATPIRAEMIVRGYIAGSMWRAYQAGRRSFCGVELPEGLSENGRLPTPVVTPTTKEDSDQETSHEALVAAGVVTDLEYTQMYKAALELYAFGAQYAEQHGLVLADTKYEFGTIDGTIHLIDEIHTPDSSRYWDVASYRTNPIGVAAYDKEYVRAWMKANQRDGVMPLELSAEVVAGTTARYATLLQRLFGETLPAHAVDATERLRNNLVAAKVIRDGYVVIVADASAPPCSLEHLEALLRGQAIDIQHEVLSTTNTFDQVAARYNPSLEPGVAIALTTESSLRTTSAQASNSVDLALTLAARLNLPVIEYPHNGSVGNDVAGAQSQRAAALSALTQLNLRRIRNQLFQQKQGVDALPAAREHATRQPLRIEQAMP